MRWVSKILAGAVVATGLAMALPGCETMKVPPNATLVARGVGNTMYIPHTSGMLYVYDKSWNKMVYAGEVYAGQHIELNANRDKLLIDGLPRVEDIPLGEGSEYRFFLRPQRIVERRTVIEEVPRSSNGRVVIIR
jgi:hypothetical protein